MSNAPRVYSIRVEGHLGAEWSEWFNGMILTQEANGETVISGLVEDQTALFGLLVKIRDLALPLISVQPVQPE